MKGPEKFPDRDYVCVGKSEDVTQPRLLKASQKGKRDKAYPFSFACDVTLGRRSFECHSIFSPFPFLLVTSVCINSSSTSSCSCIEVV